MCLTFFKKFARNNTACPCVLAQFFKNVKHYLLNYGRIFAFKFQRFSPRFLRVCVVRCFYVVLLCGLSPFPLLAEWGTQDRNHLSAIVSALNSIESSERWSDVTSISTDVDNIEDYVRNIDGYSMTTRNYLAYVLGNFGYGQGSSQTGSFAQDFSDVKLKLDAIVTALQNLGDGGSSGSGGSGSTDINQNWVKEDTFQTYLDNFQTYYDWFRSSLGYEGGSSGSLRDDFNSIFKRPKYLSRRFNINSSYIDSYSPFPGNEYSWNDGFGWGEEILNVYYNNPWEYLLCELQFSIFDSRKSHIEIAKKQAWNDWQAHTNLVATIVTQADRFFTQPSNDPSPTPSFDASTGQIVTPSTGTGSASESFSIQPSFTNDFAVVNQDVNSVTNNFAFVKQKDIEQRYLVDGILESGTFRDYGTVASGFGDIINLGGMVIDLRSQFENYRKIITIDTINTVRSAFGYIWTFLSIVASFFTVIKISGVSTSTDGE